MVEAEPHSWMSPMRQRIVSSDWLGWLMIAAAATVAVGCANEEADPPGDTGTDTSDATGDTPNPDVDEDTTEPDATDAGDPDVPDAPVPDVDPDTDATDAGPPDVDPDVLPDAVPDVLPDATDVSPDVEACLQECGVGCPAPEFQPCATDGNRYCSTCIMDCYGLDEADDPSFCDAPTACPTPTAGTPVTWRPLTLPETCPDLFGFDGFSATYSSAAALAEGLNCDEGTVFDVDFNSERVHIGAVSDNPVGEVQDVRQGEDGVVVYLTAPRYCGGARPPTTLLPIVLPGVDSPVQDDVCLTGICEGPPRP